MAEPYTVCPDCGARIPPGRTCQEMCQELAAYTLSHGGREFLHQHLVDAYAAQHVRADTKPVALAAALIGLYLYAERQYSGRQVQQVHMALGNQMKQWPLFAPPREHVPLTVTDVLDAPAGEVRDQMLRRWARSVWAMWQERHAEIEKLLRSSYVRQSRGKDAR